MILPCIGIGEISVFAAGAIVKRDIEPYVVEGGEPAKIMKAKQ